MKLNLRTVSKDYGYELFLTEKNKLIYFYKNKSTDWMNSDKDKVLYLQSGKILIRWIEEEKSLEFELVPGMAFPLGKDIPYQLTGVEASELFDMHQD